MTDQQITKKCPKCGYLWTEAASVWPRIERANGKHFPPRHEGCGVEFVSLVSRIGRAS